MYFLKAMKKRLDTTRVARKWQEHNFQQGSFNYPFLGDESMEISRDFSLIVHCSGWQYNDPC